VPGDLLRIDLHTHSDRSDGTTSPGEVVRAAREAGLDVLALTDHDSAAGWDEATAAALDAGVVLVPGMEISCKHAGRPLHLLAYLPDPDHPPLRQMLSAIVDGREQRLPHILEGLRAVGIDLEEDEVRLQAQGTAALGRPHVADALVARGVVARRDEAFDRYLTRGRPGYVSRYAPPVEEAIAAVRGAGGVSVVAHPWGRTDPAGLQEEGLAALQSHGLVGVEADHQDHSPEHRAALRAIAVNLGLVVTGSSDYHGAGKVDHPLGCHTTEPEQLERLLGLADQAGQAVGRRTPVVVRP
jgi:predicted metal-dependent phosphoesterase TrpH